MEGGDAIETTKIKPTVRPLVVGNAIEFIVGNAVIFQKITQPCSAWLELYDTLVTADPQVVAFILVDAVEVVVGETVKGGIKACGLLACLPMKQPPVGCKPIISRVVPCKMSKVADRKVVLAFSLLPVPCHDAPAFFIIKKPCAGDKPKIAVVVAVGLYSIDVSIAQCVEAVVLLESTYFEGMSVEKCQAILVAYPDNGVLLVERPYVSVNDFLGHTEGMYLLYLRVVTAELFHRQP